MTDYEEAKFRVTCDVTVYADSERDALSQVGACLEYFDPEVGIVAHNLQGVGCPRGSIRVEERVPQQGAASPERHEMNETT